MSTEDINSGEFADERGIVESMHGGAGDVESERCRLEAAIRRGEALLARLRVAAASDEVVRIERRESGGDARTDSGLRSGARPRVLSLSRSSSMGATRRKRGRLTPEEEAELNAMLAEAFAVEESRASESGADGSETCAAGGEESTVASEPEDEERPQAMEPPKDEIDESASSSTEVVGESGAAIGPGIPAGEVDGPGPVAKAADSPGCGPAGLPAHAAPAPFLQGPPGMGKVQICYKDGSYSSKYQPGSSGKPGGVISKAGADYEEDEEDDDGGSASGIVLPS